MALRSNTLSAAQARRVALAAQGFGAAHPASVQRGHLRKLFAQLGVIQIDSVNVLVRSHYLPIFSRLGPYDPALLEGIAYAGRKRDLFEYWGHEASLLPIALQPLFRWRMERARNFRGTWGRMANLARDRRAYVDRILREVTERGPLSAGELSERGHSRGPWWGWSDGKNAIEWLFWAGYVTTAYRRGFERVYDLPERVLPSHVLAAPTPREPEAQRELIRIAARALGVATASDLRDYYRLDLADTKTAIADLIAAGELETLSVQGWKAPCYALPGLRIPRSAGATALLSPFDSLVWERSRAERLFGFAYRIEIYVPAHKRVHGYYVLPFLFGDRFAARVDLKSARSEKTLEVRALHFEDGVDALAVCEALATELRRMARWLRLDHVAVPSRTRAAGALRRALSLNQT